MREAWELGPDAATWNPDDGWGRDSGPLLQLGRTTDVPLALERTNRPVPTVRLPPPPRVDPATIAEMKQAVLAFAQAMRPMAETMRRVNEQLAAARAALDPPPDLREQTLRALRNRNTGPGGPTFDRQGRRRR